MEEKQTNQYGIVLDGKMDEPVWETAQSFSGFSNMERSGGGPAPVDTEFKVLQYEDRIFVGVKCLEPDGMEDVLASRYLRNAFTGHSVELFFSPSGDSYEFYQFIVTINSNIMTQYYSEGGNIRPDRYNPDWSQAVYIGDNYWSIEVEIPLTAFYWTYQEKWNSKWLMNIGRVRVVNGRPQYSTWSKIGGVGGFLSSAYYNTVDGFPMRPARNDVRIFSADVELREEAADGYCGFMTVRTDNAVDDTFVFTSDHADSVEVNLKAGSNEFTVPCFYPKLGRAQTMLALTRKDDGIVFKRYYPVLAQYEPIKLHFTLPEYRNNFYPGQDYTKITGTVTAFKPATMKLEGPGIETQVITPNADGSFAFETPNFEIGEAFLTVTTADAEIKPKIRRLAPSDHTMAWISGGNLVINGRPTLRRNMYARYYKIGEAFKKRYDADNLHETIENFPEPAIRIQPTDLIKGSEGASGEAVKDQMPSEEMFRKLDAVIEANKNRDFVYYYLSDEPECRGLSPVYLKHFYEYVTDKDPYHVLLVGSRSPESVIDCADWFEVHPYICPFNYKDGRRIYLRAISSLGGFVDKVVKLNRPDKCVGFLPTCYLTGGGKAGWDCVTLDEYVCHTWAAMIHGGKTLWPYAAHDMNDRPVLYEGTRYIFSSFEALEDIVLHGKRTTLYRSDDAESVLYDNGDEKMFVLVNFTQQSQTITLDGLTGTWHEFRGSRVFTENTFQLKPLEVVIGTNVVKGENLPTYADTVALIDKLEYERTHRGSLLFGRHNDITVTASASRFTMKHKLFDGMADNLAYTVWSNPDNFVEVDLTKVKPAFSKVVVGGYNIENMELKVKIGDQLSVPAVEKIETAEYSKTFYLKETIAPDALRMEFHGEQVELYELEVF